MAFELCESRGFDREAIAQRLSLVGLARPELRAQGEALQDRVIRPNCDAILDSFYSSLVGIEGFSKIVGEFSDADRLRKTQSRYLQSLGVGFDQRQYFEERLRIGSVHNRIGVPQSLYQCSFQTLQFLLIRHIPRHLQCDRSAFENMIEFILKITALDMSLAVESYCAAKMFGLEESLKIVRGERERLHHLSVTDWLTDLHNHSFSRQYLTESLDRARREESPLCVIMADLDHFKKINDVHGHLVGDQVLRIAAARMISGARTGDEIGRYGGEEFLFILRNTDIAEGQNVAERVRLRVNSDSVRSKNTEINVSLSLGVAQARAADNVDTLIDRADAALYAAKLAGRDCVRLEG
ncbi:MAG: diguanylate cyclase [Gammaproteobacteria bacterium]|nr:diguanylate cyclase [Gammaproteobacteria bacterium]MDH3750941.1 diguanylate cyclase [Gammaproteobacteria bacterium]